MGQYTDEELAAQAQLADDFGNYQAGNPTFGGASKYAPGTNNEVPVMVPSPSAGPIKQFSDQYGVGGSEVGVPFPNTNPIPPMSQEAQNDYLTSQNFAGADSSDNSDASSGVSSVVPKNDDSTDASLPFDTSKLTPREQAIHAYFSTLQKHYNNASDNDASMKEAKAYRDQANNIGNFGSAIDRMVTARSVAYGGPGANEPFWQGMKEQGQVPVDEAHAEREAQIKDYMTKMGLAQTAMQMAGANTAAQQNADMNDPNSDVSNRTWDAFNSIYPDIAAKIPKGTVSAGQIKGLFSAANSKSQADSLNTYRQGMLNKTAGSNPETELQRSQRLYIEAKTAGENAKNAANAPQPQSASPIPNQPIQGQKSPGAPMTDRERLDTWTPSVYPKPKGKPGHQTVMTNSGAELTAQQAQQNANANAEDLQKSRSQPDVNQARLDRYLVGKAQLVINDFNDKYGNQPMDSTKFHMLNLELAKIGGGGAAHEAAVAGLDPKTIEERSAALTQGLSGVPQSANVSDFVRGSQKYLQGIDANAASLIASNANRWIDLKKGGYTPQQEVELREALPEVFAPYAAMASKNAEAPYQAGKKQPEQKYINIKGQTVTGGQTRQPPGSIVLDEDENAYVVGADGYSITPYKEKE